MSRPTKFDETAALEAAIKQNVTKAVEDWRTGGKVRYLWSRDASMRR